MPIPIPSRDRSADARRRAAAAAVALLVAACATVPKVEDAQAGLFEAERAFAAHSVREGWRAAFVAHFAPDGVVFWPAPIRPRDAFARQKPADPKASTLDWRPVAGGIARSGEIGFTTGPWQRTDNAGGSPARHGIFFSVWRRGETGWQVVADAGADTDAPVADRALAPGPAIGPPGDADASALQDADRSIATVRAYAARFAPDAMLAGDASGVLRGAAIAAHLAPSDDGARFAPAHAAVARSGDLGYSYGAFSLRSARGYYLHLWTRDAQGAWRIAVATHQAGL